MSITERIFYRSLPVFLALCLLQGCEHSASLDGKNPRNVKQQVWHIDNLNAISGHSLEVLGDPEVSTSAAGKAVYFDGQGDRLLVDHNPVFGAEEFTIEILFYPNNAYPNNIEPRFFHIEDESNKNRRITVELRLNEHQQWYLDAYIKSELSQHTLIDSKLTHPVASWFHAAITYKNRQFTSYVNGKKELSALVDYLPIAKSAKTSIGARINQKYWFNGKISKAAVTHKALSPEEFVLPFPERQGNQ